MKYIIDISWPIVQGTTEYKNKGTIDIRAIKDFNTDGVRDTILTLGLHSGTHIDAPSHFLRDGKTSDELPLDRFIGNCFVLDMTDCAERISRECLTKYDEYIGEQSIILLRTVNSDLSSMDTFNPHFIYLDSSAAEYLAEKKIRGVGIDYLGIEKGQSNHETHITLLQADIGILEGLRLAHVQPGEYFLVCLPLNVIGVEAAPARAILMVY